MSCFTGVSSITYWSMAGLTPPARARATFDAKIARRISTLMFKEGPLMGRLNCAHALTACTLAFVVLHSTAQDYPSRPIRMIVPQAPGSGSQVKLRLAAPGNAVEEEGLASLVLQ